MEYIYYTLFGITVVLSLFPHFPYKHWVFRVCEFIKLQTLFLLFIVLILGGYLALSSKGSIFYVLELITLSLIFYHLYDLFPFTKFYKWFRPEKKLNQKLSKPIKLISSNVYQFNTEYHQLVDLVNKEKPDLLLTMESSSDWEKALREIESDYPYCLGNFR